MATKYVILVALTLGACATAEPLPRSPVVPAAAHPTSPLQADRVRAEAFERSSPALKSRSAPEPTAARPAAPLHRSFVGHVEVPVERVVEIQHRHLEDSYENNARRSAAARERPRDSFPINAAVGAGVGAILGHQSGRRDAGALIGGGIGLLFDLGRWLR